MTKEKADRHSRKNRISCRDSCSVCCMCGPADKTPCSRGENDSALFFAAASGCSGIRDVCFGNASLVQNDSRLTEAGADIS